MSFPSSPANGQTALVNNISYTYNSALSAWIRTPGINAPIKSVSAATPPTNPQVADEWYNTATDTLYRYTFDGTNTYWVDIESPTLGTGGTNSVIYYGNLAPYSGLGYVGVTGELKPTANVAYNLGDSTAFWSNAYINNVIANNSIIWSNGRAYGAQSTTSSVAPANPGINDTWYNTANDVLYRYTSDGVSTYWVDVESPTIGVGGIFSANLITNDFAPAYSGNINLGELGLPFGNLYVSNIAAVGQITGGGVNRTSSTTAPANPFPGDVWYNTATDTVYTWTFDGVSSYWVDTQSAAIGASVYSGNVLTTPLLPAGSGVTIGSGAAPFPAGYFNNLTAGYISAPPGSNTVYFNNPISAPGVLSTSSPTAPTNPTVGDIWYNTATDVWYRYTNDGTNTNWVDYAGTVVGAQLYTGNLLASDLVPAVGTVNLGQAATPFNNLYVQSVVANGAITSGDTIYAKKIVAGGALTTTSATAPVNPTVGDVWYNTTNDTTYTWTFDGQGYYWVDYQSSAIAATYYSGNIIGTPLVPSGSGATIGTAATPFTNSYFNNLTAGYISAPSGSTNVVFTSPIVAPQIIAGGAMSTSSPSNSPPTNPVVGDIWYQTDTDIKYRYTYDGTNTNWVDYDSTAIRTSLFTGNLLTSDLVPTWAGNINLGESYAPFGNVYANYFTAAAGIVSAGPIVAPSIIAGGVMSTTSALAPTNPTVGDVWYNTVNDTLYRWTFDGQGYYWVDNESSTIAATYYSGNILNTPLVPGGSGATLGTTASPFASAYVTNLNVGALTPSGGTSLTVAGTLIANAIVAGGALSTTSLSTNPPANPVVGDIWYQTDTDIKYRWTYDGANYQWVDYDSAVVRGANSFSANLLTADLAPTWAGNLNLGESYLPFANVYTGYLNAGLGIVSNGAIVATQIIAGGALSTSASTPPLNPTVGDVWYNTTNDVLYRYTSDGVSTYWIDNEGPVLATPAFAGSTLSGNLYPVPGTNASLGTQASPIPSGYVTNAFYNTITAMPGQTNLVVNSPIVAPQIIAGGALSTSAPSTMPPNNPTVGDIWYQTDTDIKYRYTFDGTNTNWIDYDSVAIRGTGYFTANMLTSDLAPNIASMYNLGEPTLPFANVYTGYLNAGAGIVSNGAIIASQIIAGGALRTTSSTPPANPVVGDVWYNSATDAVYTWTFDGVGYYWVDTQSAAFGPATFAGSTLNGTLYPTPGSQASIGAAGSVMPTAYINSAYLGAISPLPGSSTFTFTNPIQAPQVLGGGVNTTTSTSAPSSPVVGDVWYNPTSDTQYRYTYDGSSYYWVDYTGVAIGSSYYSGNLLVSDLVPANNGVNLGETYAPFANVFTTALNSVGNIVTAGSFVATGNIIAGGVRSTSSATAPTSPVPTVGDIWYNTTNDITYRYTYDGTNSIWVDISSSAFATSVFSANLLVSDMLPQSGVPVNIGGASNQFNNAFFGNTVFAQSYSGTPNTFGNIVVTGSIAASANNVYNIGSIYSQFNTAYLSGNGIVMGNATISTDATTGAIAVIPRPSVTVPNPVGFVFTANGGITTFATTAGVPAAGAVALAATGNTGTFSKSTTSTTPPTNPNIGDVWYDSSTDIVYRYNFDGVSTYWVDTASAVMANTAGSYRTVTDFTATGGQTVFTPPAYTVGYLDVYKNGVKLNPTQFTATDGATVVLSSGATNGDTIETVAFYVSTILVNNNSVGTASIQANAVTTNQIAYGSITVNQLSNPIQIPNLGLINGSWTTGTRPASPLYGQMGYNTTLNALEAYVTGGWTSIAANTNAYYGNIITTNGLFWANGASALQPYYNNPQVAAYLPSYSGILNPSTITTGNITSSNETTGNIAASGNIVASGNLVAGGNITAGGSISTSGNIVVTGSIIGTGGIFWPNGSPYINGFNSTYGNLQVSQYLTPYGIGNVALGNITANVYGTVYANINSPNITGNTGVGAPIGYLTIPQNNQGTNSTYTFQLTDSGQQVYTTTSANISYTIPAYSTVPFPIGTTISVILNGTGNVTVTSATGVTLILSGATYTGTLPTSGFAGNNARVISPYGMATIVNIYQNGWMIAGSGIS